MSGENASGPGFGYVVRILDLSGGAEDNIVEDVKGFGSVEHANAFARSYVVDSLERCRQPGIKISARSFGRDRRYPITNGFTELVA